MFKVLVLNVMYNKDVKYNDIKPEDLNITTKGYWL